MFCNICETKLIGASFFFNFRIRYDDDVEVILQPIPININITSKSFTEPT